MSADDLLARAREAARGGESRHALDLLKTSLTRFPDDRRAREILATAGLDLRFEGDGFVGHAMLVDRAATTTNGALAATASNGDGTVRIWNVATKSLLAIHARSGAPSDQYRAMALEPSGDVLVVAHGGGWVERIDTHTGRLLDKHVIDPNGFETCALSKNGAYLACAQGTLLEVWKTTTGECVSTREDPSFQDPTDYKAEMRAYVFDFDDDFSGPDERQTRIKHIVVSDYGTAEPKFERPEDMLPFEAPRRAFATSLARAPDGAIAIGRYDGSVTIHAPTGKVLRSHPAPTDGTRNREVMSLDVSRDGAIAVGRYDASIEVLDSRGSKGGEARVLHAPSTKHVIGVRALRWSPDGTLLVGLDDEGRARWARSNGTRGTFDENERRSVSLALAFHPSGETFATSSHNDALHLWRTSDLAKAQSIALGDSPRAIAFSPSGHAVAVAVEEELVVFPYWAGALLEKKRHVVGKVEAPAELRAVVWLDDLTVCGGASDGTVYVWSANEIGSPRIVLDGHCSGIEAMLAEGERTLLTTARDGMVARWQLDVIERHGSFSAALKERLRQA